MKKIWIIVLAIVAIVVFVGIYMVSIYNGFVSGNLGVDQQFSQVETVYQRRFDLIPNLVESVKGAQNQEKEVFTALANARTAYGNAKSVDDKVGAINQTESALARLLVIVENYPELKSNETMLRFMDELAGSENRVAVERKRFNEVVGAYNIKVKRFPGNLFASIFGFEARDFFAAETGAEKAPKVEFGK